MPRQNRRPRLPDRARPTGSYQSSAQFRGVEYTVRTVTGQSAGKPYRCPGCQQLILPGTPHIVAWPHDDLDAADRRHWHTACWAARERR